MTAASALAAPVVAFEATHVQEQLFALTQDGRYRYIGFGGGIRGAKTWGGLALLVTLARVFPRSRWAIVRMDLPTLRRNTVPSFDKLREEYFGTFVGPLNLSTWTYQCANGSEIILFPESLDIDPDLSRWKGLEVNGLLLEEADELAEKSFFKAQERAGSWVVPNGGRQPDPQVFVTFNPCANWPKYVFYEPWKAGTLAPPYAFVPATAADNPHIPETTREAWKNLPAQEYRRFVEGDWDSLAGRFYAVDRRVHVVQRSDLPRELPPWWTYWGSFDWGFAHWAVYGAWAQDGDGRAYLLDSVWMRELQDDDQAGRILEANVPRGCLAPVYAGHDCWEVRRARGASGVTTAEVFALDGIALRKADIDRVNGGRAVRRALDFTRDAATGAFTKHPQLLIVDTPGNRRVLDQLATIMPDENDVNKPGKVDADSAGRGGDDGADMFRYGVASHRALAIEPGVAHQAKDHAPPFDPRTGRPGKRMTAEEELARMYTPSARPHQVPRWNR